MPRRTKSPYIVKNNIAKYRNLRTPAWTQVDLSFATRIPVSNIASWELQRYQPNPENRKKLIRVFGKQDDLFIFSSPLTDEPDGNVYEQDGSVGIDRENQ